MIAYMSRPAERGFTSRAADVVRVEVIRVFLEEAHKPIYLWCFYNESVLTQIEDVDSEGSAALKLAAAHNWQLLGTS